jgi:hypothetical protein
MRTKVFKTSYYTVLRAFSFKKIKILMTVPEKTKPKTPIKRLKIELLHLLAPSLFPVNARILAHAQTKFPPVVYRSFSVLIAFRRALLARPRCLIIKNSILYIDKLQNEGYHYIHCFH